MRKVNAFYILCALALSACEAIGPAPVVTQAERDAIHAQLNFRDQCLAVVKNQPLQSVDPQKDCDCVHRASADIMPAWIVRKIVDYDAGKDRTPYTAAQTARFEREMPATAIAAYRQCGVIP